MDSVHSSVLTFDESIIEDHKNKNDFEMDRLYAAVAEYEKEKEQSVKAKSPPLSPLAQHPPELQHLRVDPEVLTESTVVTAAEDTAHIRAATAPPRALSQTNVTAPGMEVSARHSRPAPLALEAHHSRASSRTSIGSFSRKLSPRNMHISPPMGSPDMAPENLEQYGESEPLTPRQYAPGPPPTPPYHTQSDSAEWQPQPHVNALSPVSSHFSPGIRSSRQFFHPRSPGRATSIKSIGPKLSDATIPSQTPTSPQFPFHPAITIAAPPTASNKSRSRTPAPLSLSSSNPSNASLPLRTAPLPLRGMNPNRVSMIKATTLEHKPQSTHLRAPLTGVPSTPYSPYMPFTPLTPMTPSRLVTRAERKQREKEERKRVATIDDLVPEDDEMWGEGI